MLTFSLLACFEIPAPPPSIPASGATAVAPEPDPPSRELASFTLVATGDLLMHRAVQQAAERKGGYDALFAPVRSLVGSADAAFANLETPIAPTTGKPNAPWEFNAPPALLTSLASAGFDVVSFANNHVYDQGRAGFVETLDHLAATPLTTIGAGRTCAEAAAPRFVSANGLKVAFLATSRVFNTELNAAADKPCVDVFDLDRSLAAARAAREGGADAVVLSIHWGVEYATLPTREQVETARALVEGGVDVVLGHHPHVLAPLEVVHAADGRVGVIAYSLGNFVSNQSAWYEPGLNPPSAANPRDGALLSVRVVRREYGTVRKVVRTELADLRVVPLWTTNNGTTRGDGPPDIGVEPLLDRMERLRTELERAPTDPEVVRAASELDEMERRWIQVTSIVGEQFLVERAPPTR